MSLEIAVLGPALLLLIFSVVQVALVGHARSIALAAAQEGATAASAYGAGLGAGQARASEFLARVAGDSLQATTVLVSSRGPVVRVAVTGRSLSVLPGLRGVTIQQVAEAPVERVTGPGAP